MACLRSPSTETISTEEEPARVLSPWEILEAGQTDYNRSTSENDENDDHDARSEDNNSPGNRS